MGTTTVKVPLGVCSLEAIQTACISLPDMIDAQLTASDAAEAEVCLQVEDDTPVDVAERLFWRSVVASAVQQNERRAQREVETLFAESANAISTEGTKWFRNEIILPTMQMQEESPHAEPSWATAEQADTEAGYTVQYHLTEQAVKLVMDRKRFTLPVLLRARQVLRNQVRVAISNLNTQTVVVLNPMETFSLEQAVSLFLDVVLPWAPHRIPRVPQGTACLEDPLDESLLALSSNPDHPGRPGTGLPLTYFQTVYGNMTGLDSPYILNEFFPLEIEPGFWLISTRHKAWAIITSEEYRQLLELRVHENVDAFEIYEALGIILTRRNAVSIAHMHGQRYGFLHRPPTLFLTIPTNRCNLGCVYCHAEAGDASETDLDMDLETAHKSVDFFLEVPNPIPNRPMSIEFQGGECVLRWDMIKEIMNYAEARAAEKGRQIRFNICTNLTTMTKEIAEEIKRRGIVVSSSLDGCREVHNEQRPFQTGFGSYDKVIEWSNRLRHDYQVQQGFLPTLTRKALGHEAELVDEYRRHGMPTLYLRHVNKVGRACTNESDEIGLEPEEYLQLWHKALGRVLDACHHGEHMVERKTAGLVSNMMARTWSYMCLRRPCGTGLHQVVIDQRGEIYSCDQARSIPQLSLGNINTHTYDECYTSDTAKALRTINSELLPICSSCAMNAYCGYCVCRGIRQHQSPQPVIPDDFECQLYRKMIPEIARMMTNPLQAAQLTSWVTHS